MDLTRTGVTEGPLVRTRIQLQQMPTQRLPDEPTTQSLGEPLALGASRGEKQLARHDRSQRWIECTRSQGRRFRLLSEAGLIFFYPNAWEPNCFCRLSLSYPPATQVALNRVAALQSLARMTLPSTAPGPSLSRPAAIGFGLRSSRDALWY